MEKQSLKINIAGRTIPVVAENPAEGAAIQAAATLIQEKIADYRALFKSLNDTDIILMSCLDISTQWVKAQQQKEGSAAQVETLMQYLSKIEEKLELSHYIDEN
ncbi:MAG: cell division protein ZapA [Bacteroidia bacterium]